MKQINTKTGVAVGVLGGAGSLVLTGFGLNEWFAVAGFAVGMVIFFGSAIRMINSA